MKQAGAERILVRVPNWIGDAVMSLPALVCLKRHLPEGSITVLAKDKVVPVFEALDRGLPILRYDDRGVHRGIGGLLRLKEELKREGFSAALLFQNGFEAALVARLAGIKKRVGYARHMRGPLLTDPLEVTDEVNRRHQVYYYLEIVRRFGLDVPDRVDAYPELHVDASLDGLLPEGEQPILGLSIGASYGPAKRWKMEGFKEVAERLAKEYGMQPVIFGGKEDVEGAERLKSMLEVESINLAGRIGLKEFIGALKRVTLFLTNDSGPMHLAAATGTPVVALFLSTEPVLTAPLGRATAYLASPVECRPCFRRTCPVGDYRCMDAITVDDVYRKCVELLERDEKRYSSISR